MGQTKTRSAGPGNVRAAKMRAGAVGTNMAATGIDLGPTDGPEPRWAGTGAWNARRQHNDAGIEPPNAAPMDASRPQPAAQHSMPRPHQFFDVAGMHREAEGGAPGAHGPQRTLQFHVPGVDTGDQPWPRSCGLSRKA
jgi:hypothetical protein